MQKISVKNSLYKKIREVAEGESSTPSQVVEKAFYSGEKNQEEIREENQEKSGEKSDDDLRLELLGAFCQMLPQLDLEELHTLVVSYKEAYPEKFGDKKS